MVENSGALDYSKNKWNHAWGLGVIKAELDFPDTARPKGGGQETIHKREKGNRLLTFTLCPALSFPR